MCQSRDRLWYAFVLVIMALELSPRRTERMDNPKWIFYRSILEVTLQQTCMFLSGACFCIISKYFVVLLQLFVGVMCLCVTNYDSCKNRNLVNCIFAVWRCLFVLDDGTLVVGCYNAFFECTLFVLQRCFECTGVSCVTPYPSRRYSFFLWGHSKSQVALFVEQTEVPYEATKCSK